MILNQEIFMTIDEIWNQFKKALNDATEDDRDYLNLEDMIKKQNRVRLAYDNLHKMGMIYYVSY